MSRSGYNDDYGCDNQWDLIRWRGAVASAIRGRKGQAFLVEMLTALDHMETKRLIANDLEKNGEVCAIGSVGKARGIDMGKLDPEDRESVAHVFGIAPAMAAEIVWENDEQWGMVKETPEARYERMRRWIVAHIKADTAEQSP